MGAHVVERSPCSPSSLAHRPRSSRNERQQRKNQPSQQTWGERRRKNETSQYMMNLTHYHKRRSESQGIIYVSHLGIDLYRGRQKRQSFGMIRVGSHYLEFELTFYHRCWTEERFVQLIIVKMVFLNKKRSSLESAALCLRTICTLSVHVPTRYVEVWIFWLRVKGTVHSDSCCHCQKPFAARATQHACTFLLRRFRSIFQGQWRKRMINALAALKYYLRMRSTKMYFSR